MEQMTPTNCIKFSLNCASQLQARCLGCLGHCKSVSWGQWIKSWIRNLWGKAEMCIKLERSIRTDSENTLLMTGSHFLLVPLLQSFRQIELSNKLFSAPDVERKYHLKLLLRSRNVEVFDNVGLSKGILNTHFRHLDPVLKFLTTKTTQKVSLISEDKMF